MFKGSMVALVTPMKNGVRPDSELDWKSLEGLIEFHIENNTDAIVAVGTTGESATLSPDEHCDVIDRVVTIANGRIPVIAGTGANSTTEAINLTQRSSDAGADACLLVTPYYNKPTQEGLYLHYKTIAEAVDIPQILYNVPGRTACDMLPETVGKLSQITNIIGIKEATGDLDRVEQLRSVCDEDFILLSGDDATACDFILLGGDGVISVTANVAPGDMREMCCLADKRQTEAAKNINARLAELHSTLFLEANPIPVKWAVHHLELVEKGIRLPMTWLSTRYEQELITAMQTAKIL